MQHKVYMPTEAVLQVVQEAGVYANGQVLVQPLPAAMYGDKAQRTVPLRRLETVLTESQVQEHIDKEQQKVSTPAKHMSPAAMPAPRSSNLPA